VQLERFRGLVFRCVLDSGALWVHSKGRLWSLCICASRRAHERPFHDSESIYSTFCYPSTILAIRLAMLALFQPPSTPSHPMKPDCLDADSRLAPMSPLRVVSVPVQSASCSW